MHGPSALFESLIFPFPFLFPFQSRFLSFIQHHFPSVTGKKAKMVSALILIAEGTEEMEFTITYDILVRAGITIHSALVGSSTSPDPSNPHSLPYVTCSRGVKILPDLRLPDLAGGKALDYDAIIVPGGGKGAEIIAGNQDVQKLISAMYEKGKVVGAVCAGSLAVKEAGVGKDGGITSHPSVKEQLDKGMY